MTVKEAREQFRTKTVNVLFIAEAPPCTEDRFFYFPDMTKGDSLFLHIIRAVYPELNEIPTKELRGMKEELLYRFQEDGYFLEDSCEYPLPKGCTSGQKLYAIIANQESLLLRIAPYKNSKVVLLSATVFKANDEFLKAHGFNVLNTEAIPFPGSGQQNNFKRAISKIELWQ